MLRGRSARMAIRLGLKRLSLYRILRLALLRRSRGVAHAATWAEVQSTLALVGTMTVAWSGVERILDELIGWYQHNATTLVKDHPRSLSSKLDYLKVMQRDQRFTPETREFLRTARIRTKALGAARHDLTHGLLHRRTGEGGGWHTQRVIYNGRVAELANRPYQ